MMNIFRYFKNFIEGRMGGDKKKQENRPLVFDSHLLIPSFISILKICFAASILLVIFYSGALIESDIQSHASASFNPNGSGGWVNADVTGIVVSANRKYRWRRWDITRGTYSSWSGWRDANTNTGSISINVSGEYRLQVQLNSSTGTIIDSNLYRIDKNDPNIIFRPNSSSWTNSLTVRIDTNDGGGSGVAERRHRVSRNNGSTWGSWTAWSTSDQTRSFSNTNTYKIEAQARDNAGNLTTLISGSYQIDSTNPTAPTINMDENWINGDRYFNITGGSDADSGLNRRQYSFNNSNWTTVASGTNVLARDTSGTTTVYARTVDNAGNASSVVSKVARVDKTDPTNPTLNLDESWINGDRSFTISGGSDAHSGIDRYQYRTSTNGGSSWGAWTNYPGTAVTARTTSGQTHVQARTVDKVGRVSTGTASRVARVDKTDPTNPTLNLDEGWINGDRSFTISGGSDAHSGIDRYQYRTSTDGGSTWGGWTNYPGTAVTARTTSGQTHVQARTVDKVGRVSTGTASRVARVDKTDPTNPTLNLDEGWINGDRSFTISGGSDAHSGIDRYQYRTSTDGGSTWGGWTNYPGTAVTARTTSGQTHVQARTVDKVGRVSTGTASRVARVDKTAPNTFTPTATVNSSAQITIQGTTTDNHSGLHSSPYAFSQDDGSGYTVYGSNSSYSFTGLSPNTSYVFRMKAKDALNIERISNSVTQITFANVPSIGVGGATTNSISVTIDPNENPSTTEYYVQRSTTSDFSSGNTVVRNWVTGTTFTDTGLTPNVRYYYRVKARNGNNVETAYSSIVNEITPKGTQGTPLNIIFDVPTYGSSQSISWGRMDTASSGYEVQISRNGGAWVDYDLNVAQPTSGNPSLSIPASEFNSMGTRRFRIRAKENESYYASDYGESNTRTVAQKGITGSFTASNKVYNGTNAATVATRSLTGVVAGDTVTLTGGTATFDNATVGTGKTVTLTGATLTGTHAANYTLSSVSTTTANITAKALTGSFTASNKVYDGTTAATVATRSLTGVVSGDTVTLTGGTATFDSATVGNGKTVTLTGATLTGTHAANYTLSSVSTTTANITAKALTGSFTANNKEYDGTTAATVATRTLTGVLAGDTVTLTGGTATFDSATVGTGKTVTLTGATLTGTHAANYTLSSVSTTTANITAKVLTVTAQAKSKVYGAADPALTYTVTGLVGSDTLTGSLTRVAGTNVGTYAINQGTVTGGSNYTITYVGANLTITAKAITGSFTANNKVYDGTTAATVATRSLTGVLAGDTVTLTGGTATFDSATVGNGKTVTLTGATLTGTHAANYTLSSVSTTTANITAKGITVTAQAKSKVYGAADPVLTYTVTGLVGSDTLTGSLTRVAGTNVGTYAITQGSVTGGSNYTITYVGANLTITAKALTGSFTANNKVYDGTTAATVATRSLTGVVAGDTVTLTGGTATFDSATVGNGKTVTLTGATLTGTHAANYTLSSVSTTTANITAKALTGSFTASNKVYDGTTAATVATRSLTGVVSGDTVTLTGGTATFDSATVGNGKTVTLTGATLTGTHAANYTLSSVSTTTANITAKALTGSFTANNKEYDGTTAATVATRTLTGVLAGDTVTLTGGTATFDSATVGTGKTVTLTGATLTGTHAANYTLSSVSTTTANITAKVLTVTAQAKSKVYGAADPALTYTVTGLVGSDTLTGSLTRVAGTNVGTYAINQGTVTGGSNYTITYVGANLTITAKAITGSFTANNKVYDGTTAATVATRSLTGVLAGDTVTLTGGTATFDSATVGNGKTVTLTGATLTGTHAANYTLSSVSTTTANITAKGITVTAQAKSKVYGAADPVLTYTVTGLVGSDTLTGSLTRVAGTNVGTYAITQGSVTGGSNYTITYVGANLTITAKALTGSFTANNKVYDGTTAATVATRSLTGVVAGDTVTLTGGTATFDSATVGNGKTVTLTGATLTGTHAANYTLSSVSTTTANITAKAVTVTAEAKSKVYGAGDPVLTYTTSGLVGGDTISGALARNVGENVGTYAITQGTVSVGSNYTITYVGANLTITKAAQAAPASVTFIHPATFGQERKLTWSRVETASNGYLVERSSDGGTTWTTHNSNVAQPALGNPEISLSGTLYQNISSLMLRVSANTTSNYLQSLPTNSSNLTDLIAPTVTFSPFERDWSNTPSVTVTPSDTGGSGVYRWRWSARNNGGAWWNSPDWFTDSHSITLGTEGLRELKVEIFDNAGNVNELISGVYKVDNTAPTIDSLTQNPLAGTWTNNDVEVTASISDLGGSGISHKRYAAGNQNVAFFNNGSGGFALSAEDQFSVSENGVYTVYARDHAGNETVGNINITNMDKTPPAEFTPTATADSSTQITITGSTTDAESGMNAAAYRFRVGENSYTNWQEGTSYQFTGLTLGTTYSFNMEARDNVGNIRTSGVVTATTSKENQNAPANITFEVPTYGSYQTLSWNKLETANEGYEVEINRGDGFVPYSDSVSQSNVDTVSIIIPASEFSTMGTRQFRVRAKETNTHNESLYSETEIREVQKAPQDTPIATLYDLIDGVNGTLMWTNMDTANQGYRLKVYRNRDGNQETIVNIEGSNTSYSLSNTLFNAGDGIFFEVQAKETSTHMESLWVQSVEKMVRYPGVIDGGRIVYDGDWENALQTATFNGEEENYKETIGDYVVFGGITWRIIHTEGSQALLFSEEIIDMRDFDDDRTNDWQSSDIHAWLNADNGFLDSFQDVKDVIVDHQYTALLSRYNLPPGNSSYVTSYVRGPAEIKLGESFRGNFARNPQFTTGDISRVEFMTSLKEQAKTDKIAAGILEILTEQGEPATNQEFIKAINELINDETLIQKIVNSKFNGNENEFKEQLGVGENN
jgi:hypothetical protein